MTVKYLYLQSVLHPSGPLLEKVDNLLKSITNKLDCNFISVKKEELSSEPFSLVYVATGGTAGLLGDSLSSLKSPIILVTSGSDNSLSASMEMLTFIKQQGVEGKILHGTDKEVSSKLSAIISAYKTMADLKGKRLGMVGQPSDWLISTKTDYEALASKIGVEVVQIEMAEFLFEIDKKSYPNSPACEDILSHSFNKSELIKALEIYGALTRLVEKYKLSGLSLRCFDLLGTVKNTGCLGLALLNSQGIFSSCEGDFPSLISMFILGTLSQKPVFQCNPSRINCAENKIVFAHCTLPLNMPSRYTLKTHFESDLGVAISGEIPTGAATIFKASGNLDRHFLTSAEILRNLNESDLCRTQIELKCDASVDNFLNNPIGNHYLVCNGDYTENLKEFFAIL